MEDLILLKHQMTFDKGAKTINGKKDTPFQEMLGNPNIYMQKTEVGLLSDTYTKINSKWVKDLNVRPKTIQLLEENNRTKDS